MAVECVVPLLEMGVTGQEVLSIIDTALKEVGVGAFICRAAAF